MSYGDLEARASKCSPNTIDALRRAVREEAKELLTMKSGRQTPRLVQEAQREAEAFYVTDVEEWLSAGQAIRPEDVLCYRRKATAWALAEMIRRAEKGARR